MYKKRSFLITAIILMLAIIAGLNLMFSFTPKYPIITLDKGWTVSYRNEHYLNTNLERLGTQINTTFSKGDVLTLTMTKPLSDIDVPFPYLMFKTQFCAYEVYLDDTLIKKSSLKTSPGLPLLGLVSTVWAFHGIMLAKSFQLSCILQRTTQEQIS